MTICKQDFFVYWICTKSLSYKNVSFAKTKIIRYSQHHLTTLTNSSSCDENKFVTNINSQPSSYFNIKVHEPLKVNHKINEDTACGQCFSIWV